MDTEGGANVGSIIAPSDHMGLRGAVCQALKWALVQLECRLMREKRETGFEPAPACLEGRYSTNLSYSRKIIIILALKIARRQRACLKWKEQFFRFSSRGLRTYCLFATVLIYLSAIPKGIPR